MNISDIFLMVIICLIIIILTNIFKDLFLNKIFNNKNDNEKVIKVTPEEKDSDMSLIYEALDLYILKELHNFSTKDFKFTDKSDVKELYSGNYRMLIRCLLSPNQIINLNSGGEKQELRSLFHIFINKIYLNYISETSSNIKSLLFKYYSGYTKDDYFIKDKKKKSKPSALPFITNYVRNYLWCRYEENEDSEQKLLNSIRSGEKVLGGADSYEKAMEAYDKACCRKIALNIYHTNDIVDVSDNKTSVKLKRTTTIAPKSISDFGLNRSEKELSTKHEK